MDRESVDESKGKWDLGGDERDKYGDAKIGKVLGE